MKNLILTFALVLGFVAAQATVTLSGSIGKYKISMELNASTDKEYSIKGRYNYAGKTSFLDLKGSLYGSTTLYLSESFGGKETGEFFLEYNPETSVWEGKWIGNGKFYETTLKEQSGDMSDFAPYDLDSYHKACGTGITGTYVSESYWINDYFFNEESPALEIGFNGGVVAIKEISKDEIEFQFELTCGPTYHMAYLSGKAKRVAPGEHHYNDTPMEGEGPCEVHFKFTEKNVELSQQTDNFACGFGMRAYADGSFMKVSDKKVEGEELSIQDAIAK